MPIPTANWAAFSKEWRCTMWHRSTGPRTMTRSGPMIALLMLTCTAHSLAQRPRSLDRSSAAKLIRQDANFRRPWTFRLQVGVVPTSSGYEGCPGQGYYFEACVLRDMG